MKARERYLSVSALWIKITTAHWTIHLAPVWAIISSFILPIQQFLVLTLFLVFADLYAGIRAAKKRGEKIVSRGFYRTVEKLLLYFVAILCAHGLEVAFMIPFVSYTAAFAVALSEFWSIIENIEQVTGAKIKTLLAARLLGWTKKTKHESKEESN